MAQCLADGEPDGTKRCVGVEGKNVAEVSDIGMYRDGGTIVFRLSGFTVDGLYRLRTPLQGLPQPLFRDDVQLPFGGEVEVAVLAALRGWLAGETIGDAAIALSELTGLSLWQNLPERLNQVVPLWRIRHVVERLAERVPA
jgi:hypothetical protein